MADDNNPEPETKRRLSIPAVYVMLGIVLAVAIIPSWMMVSYFQKEYIHNLHHENKIVIKEAVERWANEKGRWPRRDLADIGNDKNYFPNGLPTNPITGQPYSIHRVTHLLN